MATRHDKTIIKRKLWEYVRGPVAAYDDWQLWPGPLIPKREFKWSRGMRFSSVDATMRDRNEVGDVEVDMQSLDLYLISLEVNTSTGVASVALFRSLPWCLLNWKGEQRARWKRPFVDLQLDHLYTDVHKWWVKTWTRVAAEHGNIEVGRDWIFHL